jgi:hypothetical protein
MRPCTGRNSGRNRVVIAGEEFTGRGESRGTTGGESRGTTDGASAEEAPPDDTSASAVLVPQPIALPRAG